MNRSRMLMQRTCIAALLLFLAGGVAFPTTWQWKASEADIVAFRYQIGGEQPDGWTEVAPTVLTYEAENPEEASLYVQQSKDGEIWSDSLVLGGDGRALLSLPTVYRFEHGLDLLVGGALNLDTLVGTSWFHDNTYVQPDRWVWPTASFDYTFARHPWGFGLRTGVGYGFYDPLRTYRFHTFDIHALGTLGFFSSRFGLELGLGLMAWMPTVDISRQLVRPFGSYSPTIFYGPLAEVTLDVSLSDRLVLLAQVETRLSLYDALVPYGWRSDVRVGFGYRL